MLQVYFTNFPHQIYHLSNARGNLAMAGIGLSLIQSQKFFWLGNMGILLLPYSDTFFVPILLGSIGLYAMSIHKLKVINYLKPG